MSVKCCVALCFLWVVCSAPAALHAQEVSAPVTPNVGETRPPVIAPPKLKQFIEPRFPPDALAQGISGRVEIELVVGVDGRPSDLRIKTPAGYGFDEAALAAAQQLSFEPATRDGVPIAARIVLPYAFEFKPPPPPPEDLPPPPARIEGRVLDEKGTEPIAGVEVIISNPDRSLVRRAATDTAGRFNFEGFPAGQFKVALAKPDWVSFDSTETLVEGESTEVTYRLQPAPDKEAFSATARIPPPPREVTRRTIPKEQLTRIPGTRGDALRTVEILPGVARPPFGAGQLIVRGSSPADTQVLLDGIPVALLYHFGGLTSFINSRLLESVDFYPGNFSVRYGRRRGGIVEATLADPARDGLHGVLDLNLIDGSIFAQGPITRNWEFAAAARRSWIDLTLGAALESADVSTVAAPVYYDYQLLTTYRPSDDDRLRLMIYGSSDNFKLLFQQPSDMNQAISGNFKLETEFHRAHVSWSRKVSDRVDHDLEVAAGTFRLAFGAGDSFDFSSSGAEIYGRSEWRARVTDKVRLIAGLDLAMQPVKVSYDGPAIQQQEGSPENGTAGTSISNRSRQVAKESFVAVQPALYLESNIDFAPVRFILGSRIDYYNNVRKFSFDPRLAVVYSLSKGFRLKGGLGMFSQPPQFQEAAAAFGNPKLGPTHTVHAGFGFEYDVVPGVRFGVEGFYKYLFDRVVGTDFGDAVPFKNGGKGRILGLEVQAKIDPKGRFFGYLSYTLSRSERLDEGTGRYRLFDFDQPHILSLVAVYRLGRGWEAGLTFRLISGNPSTPVIGAAYNKDTMSYSPIYGELNSVRSPYFHRLDVRVEKTWSFTSWKLAAYLDIQNVYNAANIEGIAYDFEYRQSQKISGLPILPNIGLRGEL